MERVCVYCGSSQGREPAYADGAEDLGEELADRGLELVYGGASVGLMGTLADAVLAAGGKVTGVIPEALYYREVPHEGITNLEVVGSMHERKQRMVDLADGFIALPGGLGTVEELFEVLTWAQLGFHDAPCGILNVAGYYDDLAVFLDHAVAEEFVAPAHREMLLVSRNPGRLLDEFEEYTPPEVEKWIDTGET